MYQDPYAPRDQNPNNQLFAPPDFGDQGSNGSTADTLAQLQALSPYIGAAFPPPPQQQQQQSGGSISGLLGLFG